MPAEDFHRDLDGILWVLAHLGMPQEARICKPSCCFNLDIQKFPCNVLHPRTSWPLLFLRTLRRGSTTWNRIWSDLVQLCNRPLWSLWILILLVRFHPWYIWYTLIPAPAGHWIFGILRWEGKPDLRYEACWTLFRKVWQGLLQACQPPKQLARSSDFIGVRVPRPCWSIKMDFSVGKEHKLNWDCKRENKLINWMFS